MNLFPLLVILGLATGLPNDERIDPFPCPVRDSTLREWHFQDGTAGWSAEHQCTVQTVDGRLEIHSTGDDPYFHCPVSIPGGRLAIILRAKFKTEGTGAIFYTTD